MLTKNYYKALAAVYRGITSSGNGNFELTRQSGYPVNIDYSQARYYVTHSYPSKVVVDNSMASYGYPVRHAGIAFGDSNKVPTLDDITLAGNLITTLTGTVSHETTMGDNGCETTFLYTLTNTGSASVTIKEMGVFSSFAANDADTAILIDRVVLDDPVTIPAGNVGLVTYTFKVNYPA